MAILLCCAATRAEPPAKRCFADSVGLVVKFSQGEPQSNLKLLKELGVRWVRDTVAWPELEPNAGVYKPFPPAFAQRLAFYKENRIGIIFGLWYDNPKAYPNTSQLPLHSVDAEAYGNVAAVVAKQLRASGVRFVIELYNEPHNFLKFIGGSWNGKPPAPWLDQYALMVAAAIERVKAVDPQIRLLAGDDMWVIDYWLLEHRLPASLDGLTIHPYIKAWPEMSAAQQETDWVRPFDVVDADRSLKSAVRRLRDQGAQKLGKTPAIWITEWGWPVGGEMMNTASLSDDAVAAMLPRAFITAADAGVEVLTWFSSQDSVDGPMGLLQNDQRPRKAYSAFKTMVDRIGPATRMEHLEGADHPTSGVQAYRFSTDAASTLVVWNIDGDSSATLVNTGSKAVDIRNVLGQPQKSASADNGDLQLSLSRSPIYISGVAASSSIRPVRMQGRAPEYLFP